MTCIESESEVSQSCLTLCDPMDYSLSGSSVPGIFQARVDCHFLLQGIFLTQDSNPGLLPCRQMLYRLSHQTSVFQVRNQQRESNGKKWLLQWRSGGEMAMHLNILAWQIPWTQEPGGVESMRMQKDTGEHTHTHTHTDSQWGVGRRPLWLWDSSIKWHHDYRQEPHSGGLQFMGSQRVGQDSH